MKMKGSIYRLSPISNGDRKKAAAEKHNMAYVESQAYAQDRIEDPDKYAHRVNTRARRENKRKMVGIIGAVAAMGVYMDYLD